MGMCLYKREHIAESNGNIMFQVVGCIYYGIRQKLKGNYVRFITNNPWLDASVDKYSENFIKDVAAFLKVMPAKSITLIYYSNH